MVRILFWLDPKGFMEFYRSEHTITIVWCKIRENPLDVNFGKLSALDCMLTREKCCIIEKRFGPHSVDLKALDSNCMVSI